MSTGAKYDLFKKKVLLETGIVSATMIVLLAIVYLLCSIRDDYIENNDAAQKRVDGIDTEMNTLKTKYNNILQNAELYEEVKRKQAQGELSINRQMVLEKFNQFKNQYTLNNLRLSVSPVQDLKDPQFKRKTSEVNFSEVNVALEVTTDETVYALLDTMQRELSGVSKLMKLSMIQSVPLRDDVLNAIRQRGTYPVIKADIKFIWFGINPIETTDATPDAAKK